MDRALAPSLRITFCFMLRIARMPWTVSSLNPEGCLNIRSHLTSFTGSSEHAPSQASQGGGHSAQVGQGPLQRPNATGRSDRVGPR